MPIDKTRSVKPEDIVAIGITCPQCGAEVVYPIGECKMILRDEGGLVCAICKEHLRQDPGAAAVADLARAIITIKRRIDTDPTAARFSFRMVLQ